ncbi:VTT domain-containing protein [Fluviibacterium sp. DFM31]|uniref:VTT domain-containing protein n=1 Tax=Meridianimarinicoccus marinus TaxID=3231483 RepID=A0ABV3L443_9RHOB
MSADLLALVPLYGAWVILLTTFLSCLAVPVPTSLIMLAGGGFVASGDLSLLHVGGGALLGAVLGDQAGFLIGRRGGSGLVTRLGRRPSRAAVVGRARAALARWGGVSVFLSRWLFSPLGPYVNFVGGAGGLPWRVFSIWSVAGESIWVTIYVSLGASFAGRLDQIAEIATSTAGVLAAGLVTLGLGWLIWRRPRG